MYVSTRDQTTAHLSHNTCESWAVTTVLLNSCPVQSQAFADYVFKRLKMFFGTTLSTLLLPEHIEDGSSYFRAVISRGRSCFCVVFLFKCTIWINFVSTTAFQHKALIGLRCVADCTGHCSAPGDGLLSSLLALLTMLQPSTHLGTLLCASASSVKQEGLGRWRKWH